MSTCSSWLPAHHCCVQPKVSGRSSQAIAFFSLHLTGAGSCTLSASQLGDENYTAAPTVSLTFPIAPKAQLKPPETCKVPNVVGKRLRAAKLAIKHSHCRTGRVGHAYSRKRSNGTVISQGRRPRKTVPASSTINLVVSEGRKR
jgi:hypothetical protein